MPEIMKVNDRGAIYLANNFLTGPWTTHIDNHTHFVRKSNYKIKIVQNKSLISIQSFDPWKTKKMIKFE